ncbi:DUF2786 domain-containing protein [Pseudoalteromonas sp. MMG012]|uniref:DUF7168 domain-containing protein n=1 Tax=Pseudoalteromonas sp. MMG012 TaxID=2822686 RepID=UPI001B39ECF5|nr:DUF2786 domain-containing protein [Pseudoalteromonas sp. MMG012]MBQ4852864.1 DUF2786 domain-containing protein [Pseudoalteromonas sp. MMG012]
MDKRILRKIKQCLALAKSATNENEAAAAMRSAQALMNKHRISAEDVGMSNIDEQRFAFGVNRIVNYQANLLHLIKRAFGVEVVISRSFTGSDVRFIGVTPQPELAGYCWEVLFSKLKAERSNYVKKQPKQCKRATKVARGDQFALGWIYGVSQQVKDFALSESESALVKTYKAKHYPDLTTKDAMERGKKANVGDAISDGFKAGKKHSINRPINGGSQQKISMQ